MEKIHKDALRKRRTLLVRDITPDAELWDLLTEKNIFTPIMMEYIQVCEKLHYIFISNI